MIARKDQSNPARQKEREKERDSKRHSMTCKKEYKFKIKR
jgi:hypothetical protein